MRNPSRPNLVAKRNWFYLFSFLIMVPASISLLIPPRCSRASSSPSGTTFSFRYAQNRRRLNR